METIKDILWPIAVAGGLGGFIDFLIGKTGQERAKDFLFRWWVRFDDVRWRNFGREEGLFAGLLIEKWLGHRIWSLRRCMVASGSFIILLLIGFLKWAALSSPYVEACTYCKDNPGWYVWVISLMLFFSGFSISISFTKRITVGMADLCGIGAIRNLLIFVLALVINYIILVCWSPIIGVAKEIIIVSLGESYNYGLNSETLAIAVINHDYTEFLYPTTLIEILVYKTPADTFALYTLSYLPSVVRLSILIIFVGSFLLKPLLMPPVNLVWRRIVESDKPVFTLTFGGAAAFATAISEAAKHL